MNARKNSDPATPRVLNRKVTGVTKFISSAVAGILRTAVSPVFGFGLAAAFMAAGTISLAKCGTT